MPRVNWRARARTLPTVKELAAAVTANEQVLPGATSNADGGLRLILPEKNKPITDELMQEYLNATISAGVVAVGATSTKIAGMNPKRKSLTIVNDSANVVYISLGPVAVSGAGIRLNASGGSVVLGIYTDIPYTGVVYGIASGTSNVTVTEV